MSSQKELENRLSADIHLLGDTLGRVIRQQAGLSIFGLVEQMRAYTKARRADAEEHIDHEITDLVNQLSLQNAEDLARAYTTYFELINIAEANHRIRVTREREKEFYPEPLRKSIGAAIEELWKSGVAEDEMGEILDRLQIELVFTAHPTEAKRRSVLSKLLRIGQILYENETRDLLPREQQLNSKAIQAEVTNLWLTGRIRRRKPTVTDEVKVGMFYFDQSIWDVMPEVYESMRDAVAKYYPNLTVTNRFLTFGSWMGGDRDGNPFVTADITADTLRLHRGFALERHRQNAQKLNRNLTLSEELSDVDAQLLEEASAWEDRNDDHVRYIAERYEEEPYRIRSAMLAKDLAQASSDRNMEQRLLGKTVNEIPPRLRTLDHLLEPLELMESSLRKAGANAVADHEIADFKTQAHVFGLNTATLDIRQESTDHNNAMTEIFSKLGLHDDYLSLTHDERADFITDLLEQPIPDLASLTDLTDKTDEQLKLMRVLKRAIDTYGRELIGPYIISMTEDVYDVLTVHLLCYWHGINKRADGVKDGISVAPLFETRADLEAASIVMEKLFNHPEYARSLAEFENEQCIMIGYSDSNKDAGYLAANWELYLAQKKLADKCEEYDVIMTLFHGRGGTIARGGGPMKRAIMAQPYNSVNNRFRVTEQGEVLYERYANKEIAKRHLEQMVYAVLVASNPNRDIDIKPEWLETMATLAKTAHEKYRTFVYDTPDLVTYWQSATPIKELSKMQIGSRPSKRAKSNDPFAFLRAIPWVFSWNQSRHILPGWYGVGSALADFANSEENIKLLEEMYSEWTFFKAVIDNAQLSLGKADMGIAKLYSELVPDDKIRTEVYGEISREHKQSCEWVLHITGQQAILDSEPVVQNSIRVRNPYVDPLNFLQVRLLREYRAHPEPDSDDAKKLLEALFLTINGVAAGLKNTG